jgi:hypothetical protein
MVNQKTLADYCYQYLTVDKFDDYCPNGLQIQGKSDIKKIISGVSANQALIDRAIDEGFCSLLPTVTRRQLVSFGALLKFLIKIPKNAQIILSERTKLSATLNAINTLEVYPSQANFILFKAPNANELFTTLKQKGILIKNFSNAPKLTNCLRVTVGSS